MQLLLHFNDKPSYETREQCQRGELLKKDFKRKGKKTSVRPRKIQGKNEETRSWPEKRKKSQSRPRKKNKNEMLTKKKSKF